MAGATEGLRGIDDVLRWDTGELRGGLGSPNCERGGKGGCLEVITLTTATGQSVDGSLCWVHTGHRLGPKHPTYTFDSFC